MSKLEVIKFEKPSCAPCVAVSEMLDKAGIEHQKVNYIAAIDMAQEMGVRSVPTVFAVKEVEGKKVVQFQARGANPEDISTFIEQVSSYYQMKLENEH